MAATSTEINLTTAETMVACSTPTDPPLTSSIQICETVQSTSTGFNVFYESPLLLSQSPQVIATIESETIQNTCLPSCIPSEESQNTETIETSCSDAHPSSSNLIDTVITSAAVLPTSTRASRSFEPSQPSPRGSSLIDVLKNCPNDLGFNVFLDELAAEITNEDLKRLKHYVIGKYLHPFEIAKILIPERKQFGIKREIIPQSENGIGYGTLEKMETALEFFTALRKRNILTRDNIIVLQVMLWHLKRQDLHRKSVDYARNLGNAAYFYTPSPEPENGYRYVRFHVVSNDIDAFDRCQLENVRTTVAALLLVPPEFVLVSGLEPSSSLIITFMMPEYYASLLIEMVVEYRIPQLLGVGIDKIYYDGKLYHLLGKTSNGRIQGNFRGKLEDREELLERLKRAETWLEQREKEVIELRRLLDKAELDLQKVKKEKAESKFAAILTFQTQRDFTFLESSKEKANELTRFSEDSMILSDRMLSLKPIVKYKHIRHKSCNWI